ncbi:MAG TPA: DUF1697 domain-containing protein [Candidatus Baltobacteraceae bacterium]
MEGTAVIALLRAVNVGGTKKIAMSDLRAFAEQLGFTGVRTLLQSGNLVFRSDGRSNDALERLFEEQAKERLGIATQFFVRSNAQWKRIVARNPFHAQAERDPGHLVVLSLKDAPSAAAAKALQAAIPGRELAQVDGQTAYIVYPDGIGESRLTATLIERRLETHGTGRNWNTVLKLAAAAQAREDVLT